MFKVIQLPALQDNYIYLIIDETTKNCSVIDPTVSTVVHDYIQAQRLNLKSILITHHHHDHIGGVQQLKTHYNCDVFGFVHDQHRIKDITSPVMQGDDIFLGSLKIEVIETPGHTSGHICFYAQQLNALFCGDTLFSLGCGRLFEGSAQQMFASLSKIKTLPLHTLIYCAHEYTEKNSIFVQSLAANDTLVKQMISNIKAKVARFEPTVPSTLEFELQFNPLLKATSWQEFAQLRLARDQF